MIRRVRLVLTAAVSAALFLGAAASASAGTLDQQQTANDNAAAAPYQLTSDAQSFTAGLTGGLDQVDLMLARSGTPTAYLTVEIRDLSGGVPGQAILAARSVAPAAVANTVPQFIPVQFDPPAPVVAGTQYAIVAYSANSVSNWYLWYLKQADIYPGGEVFTGVTPPSSSWTPDPTSDLAFRTYVIPTPATTPASTPSAGQRAAALASCKKRARKHHWSKQRLKKCKEKARLLPI